jgi:malate permease and related proteins
MLSIFANILLPVFLVAGISAVAQQRFRLDVGTFSRAAFYVFSPAMVIDALTNSGISGGEYGQLALGLIATTLVLWALGETAARGLGLDAPTRAAFLVVLLFGNTGNFGLPVNLFAFGEPGLARAALVVTVNSLLWSSLGVYVVARGDGSTVGGNLRNVFTAPAIYAAGIGLALNLTGLRLPEPAMRAAHILGQGLVPASLLVLGVQIMNTFRDKGKTAHLGALILVVIGRLIVAPLVAYTVAGLIGMNELARKVLTLEAATPTAVMALVLATEYKATVPFAAKAIFVTTIASVVTVAAWLLWLM